MLRVIFVAVLVVAALVVAKNQHVFERAGVVGSCGAIRSPIGDRANWQACKEGLLTGYPSLLGGCTLESRQGKTEYWRCPPHRA